MHVVFRGPNNHPVRFRWFFVVLIINLYASNLTAFMTLDKQGVPLKHATDLVGTNKLVIFPPFSEINIL